MPPTDVAVDRRRRRSDECRRAIEYQLEHLADEFDLRTLALADSSGLLIASAGPDIEGEALSAYAPVFERRLERGTRDEIMEELGDMLPGVDGHTLTVRQFDLEGNPHYLCVVGREAPCRRANLYRAVTGIRRIVRDTAS